MLFSHRAPCNDSACFSALFDRIFVNGFCSLQILTNLPSASGSSHRQHLPLFQVQADVFEDRCDVEVSEEEARVTVQVSVCFVLLLDLLKQLTNALQKGLKSESSLFLRTEQTHFSDYYDTT